MSTPVCSEAAAPPHLESARVNRRKIPACGDLATTVYANEERRHPMKTRFAKLANIVLFTAIPVLAPSCAAYKDYTMNQPSQVTETESELAQAGFRKVPIETSEQHSAVAELHLNRLNQYESGEGKVFW